MKSKLKFDWQDSDVSVQDQVGSRFKLKQENELIRKKYTDTLDHRLYHKYVEHEEEQPYAMREHSPGRQPAEEDTLAREVDHFNSSKMAAGPPKEKRPEEQAEGAPALLQNDYSGMEKYNRPSDRLNQSHNAGETSPLRGPPREMRQSLHEPQPYFDPEAGRQRNASEYRYGRPYYPNPENYNTISPAADRYRPFQPDPYPSYASPSKYVQKLYTGTVPSDYPFRNVIPDKLEHHLRDKVKADRKALKVSLNLFDYKKT